jgi:hypothetical protein
LVTADWGRSTPDVRAAFAAADPSVMVIPFAQFASGVLGALAITSEYANGMIRTVLVAVPQQAAVLCAKASVVGVGAPAMGEGALVAMGGYLVVALGGGAVALFRRHA